MAEDAETQAQLAKMATYNHSQLVCSFADGIFLVHRMYAYHSGHIPDAMPVMRHLNRCVLGRRHWRLTGNAMGAQGEPKEDFLYVVHMFSRTMYSVRVLILLYSIYGT